MAGYRILESLADSNLVNADDMQILYDLTDNTNLDSASKPSLFVVGDTESSSNDSSTAEDDQ